MGERRDGSAHDGAHRGTPRHRPPNSLSRATVGHELGSVCRLGSRRGRRAAGFRRSVLGCRNNPGGDRDIAALVDDWASHGRPLVFVRHDFVEAESPLDPGTPGNQLKPYLKADPDLTVSKSVNSAFHGTPDLHAWLVDRKTAGIVVCGITTNHCCETTARVGGNLGHDARSSRSTRRTPSIGPGRTGTRSPPTSSPGRRPPICTVSSRPSPARRSCWQGRPGRSTSGGSLPLHDQGAQLDVRRRRSRAAEAPTSRCSCAQAFSTLMPRMLIGWLGASGPSVPPMPPSAIRSTMSMPSVTLPKIE